MMPNVNRVVTLPAELYRQTMQYATRHEISWNDAIRLLVEQALGEDGGGETRSQYVPCLFWSQNFTYAILEMST